MEFGPGILDSETPVDDRLGLIAFLLPGMHPPAEAVLVRVPLTEAAAGYDAEFDLRHPFGKLRTGFSQLPCLGVW